MIDLDALSPEAECLRWRGRDFTVRRGIPLSLLKVINADDVDYLTATVSVVAHQLGITVAELEEMDPTTVELEDLQKAINTATGTTDMGGSSASADSSPDGGDQSRPT